MTTHGHIIKNLYWEFQLDRFAGDSHYSYFDFSLRWDRKTDHAGFHFNFTVYQFYIGFDIYDNRHWDDDNNDWEKYDEESSEENRKEN